MAKYEYVNGERRKYRHIDIWYDASPGRWYHWYVRTWETIASGVSVERRTYFPTIKEAKRYIDEFFTAAEHNMLDWHWDNL